MERDKKETENIRVREQGDTRTQRQGEREAVCVHEQGAGG